MRILTIFTFLSMLALLFAVHARTEEILPEDASPQTNPKGEPSPTFKTEIEKNADIFWKHFVNAYANLPKSNEELEKILEQPYRNGTAIALRKSFEGANTALVDTAAMAIYDQRYLSDEQTRQLMGVVEALRRRSKHSKFNAATAAAWTGSFALYPVIAIMAPALSIPAIAVSIAAGLGSTSVLIDVGTGGKLFRGKLNEWLRPKKKTVREEYEKYMRKREQRVWEIFLDRIANEHGLKPKGRTIAVRIHNFEQMIHKALRFDDLRRAGLLPTTSCEALLILPQRSSTLLLPPGK